MKELREIAKKAGVQGYGKFRKAELLEVLADVQPENLTVRVLRIIAKKLGTKGYAKMRKTELINVFGSTQHLRLIFQFLGQLDLQQQNHLVLQTGKSLIWLGMKLRSLRIGFYHTSQTQLRGL